MHPIATLVSIGAPLGVAASLAVFAVSARPAEPPARSDVPPLRAELAALRARGPAGLDEVLARYDRAAPAERDALAADVDAVAAQRYATVSRLYWFTELDRAEDEARRRHRPILALRMLGDLRSDLSCANSRLFRATLYADAAVSAFLRDHFVLYWSSERPVPTVTIDFGGGRKLVRTTTGNSAHYVLDERGRVLDVLPGLYAPAVFRGELGKSLALADRVRGMADGARTAAIVAYHRAAADALDRDTSGPLTTLRGAVAAGALGRSAGTPPVIRAERLTMGKASMEVRDLVGMGLVRPDDVAAAEPLWSAIAAQRWSLDSGKVLDAPSRALIARLHDAGPERRATPPELAAVVARLEWNILGDTAINELWLRRAIHRRIADQAITDFAALDAWIYDEVFATPRSDAWLGLLPRTDFTGLPGDGVVLPR